MKKTNRITIALNSIIGTIAIEIYSVKCRIWIIE